MSDQNDERYTGQLGGYKIIKTQDNSLTLRSEYFSEAFHSLNGAYAETLHNYIQPHQILDLWVEPKRQELNILEVGLGLGLGVQVTFEKIMDLNHENNCLTYIALELDESLVEYAMKNQSYLSGLQRYQEQELVYYQAQLDQHSITVLVGDARQTLPSFIELNKLPKIDVIYQDPFSPRKNPTLWTYEWFDLLAKTCKKDATLSTYCASVSPRKAMLKAGFRPKRLKGMGFKREITFAQLNACEALDPNLEESLLRSKAATLTDSEVPKYTLK